MARPMLSGAGAAMDTAQILGGFVWATVGVGYAASVWKLGRASRGAPSPHASERGTRIEIVDPSHHGGQDGLAVSRPRHRVLRAFVGVHSRLRAPRMRA